MSCLVITILRADKFYITLFWVHPINCTHCLRFKTLCKNYLIECFCSSFRNFSLLRTRKQTSTCHKVWKRSFLTVYIKQSDSVKKASCRQDLKKLCKSPLPIHFFLSVRMCKKKTSSHVGSPHRAQLIKGGGGGVTKNFGKWFCKKCIEIFGFGILRVGIFVFLYKLYYVSKTANTKL